MWVIHRQVRSFCSRRGIPTVSQALELIKEKLSKHLDDNEAVSSAGIIVAHAFSEKTITTVNLNQNLSSFQWGQILSHTEARQRRVPLQYIIGEWDFLDYTLTMKQPVLIPRPETEELVKVIQSDAECMQGNRFLEIGCGSGAITIALLKNNVQLRGIAVDIVEDACSLTRENAQLLDVEDRITVKKLSVTDPGFVHNLQHNIPFDFIVSNPPYIPTGYIEGLQDEVKLFESHIALDGGEDGLTIIRHILHHAPELLCNNGSLWLEVDMSHPTLIKSLCSEKHSMLEFVKVYKDFQNIERFCHLKKS